MAQKPVELCQFTTAENQLHVDSAQNQLSVCVSLGISPKGSSQYPTVFTSLKHPEIAAETTDRTGSPFVQEKMGEKSAKPTTTQKSTLNFKISSVS